MEARSSSTFIGSSGTKWPGSLADLCKGKCAIKEIWKFPDVGKTLKSAISRQLQHVKVKKLPVDLSPTPLPAKLGSNPCCLSTLSLSLSISVVDLDFAEHWVCENVYVCMYACMHACICIYIYATPQDLHFVYQIYP